MVTSLLSDFQIILNRSFL